VSIIRPRTPLTGGLPIARPRAPKPPKRRAPLNREGAAKVAVARALVHMRSDRICEVCGNQQATNVHHRKNRSQGGTWATSNLLHLCGSGTTGCHGRITDDHDGTANRNGWTCKSFEDPATTPCLIRNGRVILLDNGETEAAS